MGATGPTMAARCLGVASSNLFAMRRTLSKYGGTSLRDYVGSVLRAAPTGHQRRDDLLAVVHDQVSATLGPGLAERTVDDLARSPMVLTANHHGVDFFAQSLQSSLAFSLRGGAGAPAPSTTPIFACGAVPMNNFTYPRGLLAYRGGAETSRIPVRIPVFPDRMKRHLVSTACGMTRDMIERAQVRAARLTDEGQISPDLSDPIYQVLAGEYTNPDVLAESCYSGQAVMLNARIWKRLFRHSCAPREIVYLELEKIAARLLALDLIDAKSLVWRTFFNPEIRRLVLDTLDGQRACWNRAALDERLREGGAPRASSPRFGGGTVFFWAVDGSGPGVPLSLSVSAKGSASLVGIDDHGRRVTFPFGPGGLVDALRRGSLIPSLFTSYLTISFARGVSCIGGYYQAEYLPLMQHAVVQAFAAQSAPERSAAEAVASIPTHGYLSGMQAVMSEVKDRTLAPAGALEIMAGGGLSEADLDRIGNLTVGEAHLASVVDTVMDAAPATVGGDGWQTTIGEELHHELGGRVVMQ